MKQSPSKAFLLSMASCLTLLLVSSCQLLPSEYQPQAAPIRQTVADTPIETFTLKRGDLRLTETVQLRYEAIRVEDLTFPVGGLRLANVHVEMGDLVEEGQLLAELEGGSDAEQLERLELSIADAELNYARMLEDQALALEQEQLWSEALPTSDGDSLQALQEAQHEARSLAEAELDLLQLELSDTQARMDTRRIYAPFDGIVTYATQKHPNDTIRQKETVVQVSDNTMSLFIGRKPELAEFPEGSQWTVESRDFSYPIEIIDPTDYGQVADEEMVYARLLIDDIALEAGTRGSVEILLDEAVDALYVPTVAVFVAGGQAMVYVENEDGIRVPREIETGLETREFTEVTHGLEEGEVIIND